MDEEIEVFYNSDFPTFLTVRPKGKEYPMMHAYLHLNVKESRTYLEVHKTQLVPEKLLDDPIVEKCSKALKDAVWAELGHHRPDIMW